MSIGIVGILPTNVGVFSFFVFLLRLFSVHVVGHCAEGTERADLSKTVSLVAIENEL